MSQKNRRIKRIRTLTKQRHLALQEIKLLRNSESSEVVDLKIRLEKALAEAEHWKAECEMLRSLVSAYALADLTK